MNDILKQLRSLGQDKTRAIYKRHGAAEPVLGVSFAELGKLQKAIKTDHALAAHLWQSGVHEARLLACQVADGSKSSRAELSRWAQEVKDSGTAEALAALVARTAHAETLGREWRSDARMAQAGWSLVAHQLKGGAGISEKEALALLGRIESEIHGAENWTRRTMMMALISLGATTPALRREAEAAVGRLGPVAFDPGETACAFPDAIPYMAKMWARKTGAQETSDRASPLAASKRVRKNHQKRAQG